MLLKSLWLKTQVGDIAVGPSDLFLAKNAKEVDGSTILVQPRADIVVRTTIQLPNDTTALLTDDEDNVKDASVYSAIAKNARPRTGGITSAGK